MYEELNLTNWPFQTIPDPDTANIWAGRAQTKRQIDALLLRMERIPKSRIHLLWANFGMGKTHTLYHMRFLLNEIGTKFVPVYAEMPKRSRSFLDLYRVIINDLPLNLLGENLVALGSEIPGSLVNHKIFVNAPGVVNALLSWRSGDIEKTAISRQWLGAQPGLSARDLRSIGVTYRIKTPEDSIATLTSLIHLATYPSLPSGKVILMIDEYQQVGELKQATRHEINAAIQGLFNKNPQHLEVFLSFACGREDNVLFLLSDELKSRIEPRSITLDVLNRDEAIDFIRDLFSQYRLEDDGRWAFPFTTEGIGAIIDEIETKNELTPRRVMKYSDAVLSEFIEIPPDGIGKKAIVKFFNTVDLGVIDV